MVSICIFIALSTLLININGEMERIEPTISNASGEYYVTQNQSDFKSVVINCTSTVLCHIQCLHTSSCNLTDILCNNAKSCIIDCNGESSCQQTYIYPSFNTTNVNCNGLKSCGSSIDNRYITIYTDYMNHPLSDINLQCSNVYTCYFLKIVDILGEISKIISKPTVTNSTGEYYIEPGSYGNITCNHDLLCYIDCTHGSCRVSNIDCGDAKQCIVKCQGTQVLDCRYMSITVKNSDLFHLDCTSTGQHVCRNGKYNIDNVSVVDIDCIGGIADKCGVTTFNLQTVNELEVICDDRGSCVDTIWNINNIDHGIISCNDGCDHSNFNINNSGYIDFSCTGIHDACNNMNISGYSTNDNFTMDLNCIHFRDYQSCNDATICVEGELNADCCGSCNRMDFCGLMDPSMVTMECDCNSTLNTCQNMTWLTLPPTVSPTTAAPTEYTVFPTISPSELLISTISNQPTLAPSYVIDKYGVAIYIMLEYDIKESSSMQSPNSTNLLQIVEPVMIDTINTNANVSCINSSDIDINTIISVHHSANITVTIPVCDAESEEKLLIYSTQHLVTDFTTKISNKTILIINQEDVSLTVDKIRLSTADPTKYLIEAQDKITSTENIGVEDVDQNKDSEELFTKGTLMWLIGSTVFCVVIAAVMILMMTLKRRKENALWKTQILRVSQNINTDNPAIAKLTASAMLTAYKERQIGQNMPTPLELTPDIHSVISPETNEGTEITLTKGIHGLTATSFSIDTSQNQSEYTAPSPRGTALSVAAESMPLPSTPVYGEEENQEGIHQTSNITAGGDHDQSADSTAM